MTRSAAILALLLTANLAAGAEIRTTTERFDDSVSTISKQGGKLVITTSGGRTIPLEKLKEIRFSDKPPARLHDAHLWLLSGDEVVGTIGEEVKAGESFKLSTVSLGTVEVSLDSVGGILFDVPQPKEAALARKHLSWLLYGKGDRPKNDVFTLAKEGGSEGTVQHFSKDGLVFKDKGDTVWPAFPLKRLESLVLGGEAPKKLAGELRVLLRLLDGALISGKIDKLEDGKLHLLHPLGKNGPLAIDLAQVLSLEVLGGSFTYLSDLEPSKVEERFPEGFERDASFAWKRDREVVDGGPLRLGGRVYWKGLGVHSFSSLSFQVPEGSQEFRATAGLDDSIKTLGNYPKCGSATFRVLVDGKPAKEVKKSRGDAPDEIVVKVAGAKEITLVADYGDYLHVLGRADWADACLVKVRDP